MPPVRSPFTADGLSHILDLHQQTAVTVSEHISVWGPNLVYNTGEVRSQFAWLFGCQASILQHNAH
jgi:hypothetical protein